MVLSINMFLKWGPRPILTKYRSLSVPSWYFLAIFKSKNINENKRIQSTLGLSEHPTNTDSKIYRISASLTAEFVTISSILTWQWDCWQCDAPVWILVGKMNTKRNSWFSLHWLHTRVLWNEFYRHHYQYQKSNCLVTDFTPILCGFILDLSNPLRKVLCSDKVLSK